MRFAPLWSLFSALLLVGCSTKVQEVGGIPRAPVMSVVSLSPSTTEIMVMGAGQGALKGRTEADNYPAGLSYIPVVASVKPDYEAIKRQAPQVILYDADLYSQADIDKLKGLGAEMFAIKARTIGEFEKELYQVANRTGGETNMATYVDRIEKEKQVALGETFNPVPKVAILSIGGGSPLVAGKNSFVADVIKTAGGAPVGPDSDKFAPFSFEALVAAQPDIIVLATKVADANQDVQRLRSDARLRATPALKNGRVVALDADVVFRRGSRVDAFIKNLHHLIALNAN